MAKPKLNVTKPDKEFKPGKGFTKEDWDAVSDNPEWTEEDFRNARPFTEVFPDLAESIRRARGRPALDNPKKQVTLRLDSDVVARFRAGGPGWQSRINDVLRKAAGLQK
ncbi:BrnA antitoxin family protein [Bradyrhizobium sp. Arg314]